MTVRSVRYAPLYRPRRPRSADPYDRVLTTRETEVAMLVAQGLTNREIAARLTVSERTIDTHVSKIFSRLGIHRRAEIAALVTALLCLVQACSPGCGASVPRSCRSRR